MASPPPHSHECNRMEVQAAIAKTVELRALHAALVQGNSPGNMKPPRCPPRTPAHPSIPSSANDYPVFTSTYEEEILSDPQIEPKQRMVSLNWEDLEDDFEILGLDRESPMISARTPSGLFSRGLASSSMEHSVSKNSCQYQNTPLQSARGNIDTKTATETRKAPNEADITVSCNRCKPTSMGRENPTVVPLTELQDMIGLPHKDRNGNSLFKSWFFSRTKKSPANKAVHSISAESLEQWNITLERLKQKLVQATAKRDVALAEVVQLRSSVGELEIKLRKLELYCQDLKHALNQTAQDDDILASECFTNEIKCHDPKPIKYEAMIGYFLQIVSEARVSVRQLCRTLVMLIQEVDGKAMEKLSSLLQPYEVHVTPKISRGVMYHLEALINQAFYQDFENCSFQKNGVEMVLDPCERSRANFQSFTSLRNLSWDEVLSKGTKFFSGSFSKFCDQKMSLIVSMLNWTSAWPEPLLQAFFIAAKCVWLVHLLAFSFNPPLPILRVDKTVNFDPVYMEDILAEKQRKQVPSRVRIMVMPGFYVHCNLIKCKVLCRYTN